MEPRVSSPSKSEPPLAPSQGSVYSGSLTRKSYQNRVEQQHRLRLMVALPVAIVLLLTLLSGAIYYLAESAFGGMVIGNRVLPPILNPDSFQKFSRDFLIILGVFCFLGTLVGVIMAHQITAPIFRLMELSERVAAGDLTPKAPSTGADEVGMLHSSFNRMVDSLNSYFTSRNRMIVESFTGGLVTTDLNGTIVAVNSSAERLLGISAHLAVGRPSEEVFDRPDLRSLVDLLKVTLLQQSPVQRKDLLLGLPGEHYEIIVQVSPMRDQKGRIHGLVLNLRDRAEFDRFIEEMGRADRLATLGTFSAGLAHEIRNPLGAIRGTSQLLAEITKSQPELQPYLEIIVKEADRLNRLVREVKEYSNPTSPSVDSVDLNMLLNEQVLLARNHPSLAAGVEFRVDLARIPEIQGSYERLVQAVFNVVMNAVQATPTGGKISITSRYTPHQDYPVVIRVHNTGPLIPQEVLRRIFEPFYTTKSAGSGLGLAIAHQVIVYHGGRIEVANESDGVAFTLRFPRAPLPEVERT